jgi:hypothetical protein
MASDRSYWLGERPPDDPYAYRVVTVKHGPLDSPAVRDLVDQLYAAVAAALLAVGGTASTSVDEEQGTSCWLLSPPRADDLADIVLALIDRLDPGHWTTERL